MDLKANGVTPAGDLASILAGWSESAHGPLARQLGNAIRRAVASGLITEGTRLPPERTMAKALGVSRSTVTVALDELRQDLVLESRQGSGTVVRGAHRPLAASRIAEHFSQLAGIDLAAGNPPDPSHLPPIKLDVADLIAEGGGSGCGSMGLDALRSAIADQYRDSGLVTDANQIHVTAGAHQAISLLMRACSDPGDVVLVDDPSYPGVFDILQETRARVHPVASDAAGSIPEDLETALREHHPKVFYVQAGPHNPTGTVPAVGRRRAIAAILDRYDTTVIEDAAVADLAFAGRVRPELVDLCKKALVVSVGSFSKVAWAGLRVGWMRAPAPLIEQTMHLRFALDLGSSVPAQLMALRLLPHYEELAAKRRVVVAEIVERASERIRLDFPEWNVNLPAGGSVLWTRLPVEDSGAFAQIARRHGVHVVPGSAARANRAADPHLRICVDRPWPLVDVGVQRLGLAWRDYCRRADPVFG